MKEILNTLWHSAVQVTTFLKELPSKWEEMHGTITTCISAAQDFFNIARSAKNWHDGLVDFWGSLVDKGVALFKDLSADSVWAMISGRWNGMVALFGQEDFFSLVLDKGQTALTDVGVALVDFVESFTLFEDVDQVLDAAYKSLTERDLSYLQVALAEVFADCSEGFPELNGLLFGPNVEVHVDGQASSEAATMVAGTAQLEVESAAATEVFNEFGA